MMLPSHVEALVRTKAASKYWRETDARVVLAAMSDSGMPLTVFGGHFGIRVEKLRRWRRRLGESVEVGFHEVRLVEPLVTVDRGVADAMFEVVVRSGRTVKVPAGFDSAALGRLVEVLERLPC